MLSAFLKCGHLFLADYERVDFTGQSEVYTEQVAGRQGHKILTWQNNSEKDLVMREATYLANGKKIVE